MTQQNNFFTKAILEDHARSSSCIVLTQNHPRWWLWAILFVLKPFLMVMHKKLSQKRKKLLAISFHIFLVRSATSKQLWWKIGLFFGHGDISDSVLVGVTEWGCVHISPFGTWSIGLFVGSVWMSKLYLEHKMIGLGKCFMRWCTVA